MRPLSEGRYRLTLLSPLTDDEEFERFIHDDLELCLETDDRLESVDLATHSAVVKVQRLELFKRALAFQSVIIERHG